MYNYYPINAKVIKHEINNAREGIILALTPILSPCPRRCHGSE